MTDFWQDLVDSMAKSSPMDAYLSRAASNHRTVLDLSDKGRQQSAVPLATPSGTRVAFRAYNMGLVLTYPKIPAKGTEGTIVMVRTSSGDRTHANDHLFVKWDDGEFFPVHREHLRVVGKVNTSIRAASLLDLTDFYRTASEDELIHKASKDLWSVKQADDGSYLIERLFDESGGPLKV
jgi:hypothetical protein